MVYTASEVRALSPIRDSIEKQGPRPDKYDIFLCHAWDDRRTTAKELNDALENAGVSVWFSELTPEDLRVVAGERRGIGVV